MLKYPGTRNCSFAPQLIARLFSMFAKHKRAILWESLVLNVNFRTAQNAKEKRTGKLLAIKNSFENSISGQM